MTGEDAAPRRFTPVELPVKDPPGSKAVGIEDATNGYVILVPAHDGKDAALVYASTLAESLERACKTERVLAQVEWVFGDEGTYYCPVCQNYRLNGHTDDCELAAVLLAPTPQPATTGDL